MANENTLESAKTCAPTDCPEEVTNQLPCGEQQCIPTKVCAAEAEAEAPKAEEKTAKE